MRYFTENRKLSFKKTPPIPQWILRNKPTKKVETLSMPRCESLKNKIACIIRRWETNTNYKMCEVRILEQKTGQYFTVRVPDKKAAHIVQEHRKLFALGGKHIRRSDRSGKKIHIMAGAQ